MYWNTSFTYTCTFKMSIVSVQGLLAYSANCTFRDHWNLWQVYMSFQLIKTWVNKSIVRYILVRKTCAHVFIKRLYFFIYFVHKKKEILRKKYWCCTCDGCCPSEQCWFCDGCWLGRTFKNQTNNNALRPGLKPIRSRIFANGHHLRWAKNFFRGLAWSVQVYPI